MAMMLQIFRKRKLPEAVQEPATLNYSASTDEFSQQLEAWRENMVDMVVGEKIDFEKMTYFTPDVVERLMKPKPRVRRKPSEPAVKGKKTRK
ncbi:MAG: hypothetical protein O3C16_02690 [Actinobacteria bacterium]|nr:hypothetical protein [Actinomycetota bacterium]